MKTHIRFLGGAGTVTGSKFLFERGNHKVLIDCGLFQGLKDLRLQNWETPPFELETLDAVVLTHAHLDHCGYLPVLAKKGFSGPVYSTAPTRDLARVILLDSAKIQEEDAERANQEGYSKHSPAKPLYTSQDAMASLRLFQTVAPRQWMTIADGIELRFRSSGHILGSAIVELRTPETSIAFSGDLGRADPLVLHPPEAPGGSEYLVVESTYGDRIHSPLSPLKELARIVNETIERQGQLLIPAFAVGRTQDLLFMLSQLKNLSQIPDVPIFLDTPMGASVTDIFTDYPEWHRLTPKEVSDMCGSVVVVKSKQQSEELFRRRDSAIVIAGSGMLTGGRILSHLLNRLAHSENTILLVGFQAASTRGSLLRAGVSELKIYGQYVPVRARVEEISTLSAHADQKGLVDWISRADPAPKKVFIVHGEPQAANALRVRAKDVLGLECVVPRQGDSYLLCE